MKQQKSDEACYWGCGALTALISSCSLWGKETKDVDYVYRLEGRAFEDQDEISTTRNHNAGEVRTPEERRNPIKRNYAAGSPDKMRNMNVYQTT